LLITALKTGDRRVGSFTLYLLWLFCFLTAHVLYANLNNQPRKYQPAKSMLWQSLNVKFLSRMSIKGFYRVFLTFMKWIK